MALTEGKGTAEGLISEGPGYRSRDNITVLSGQNLGPATVLGKIAVATPATATAFSTNVGNGTMAAAPTVGAGAKAGTYKLICIGAGATAKYGVFDPAGVLVAIGAVGSAFSAGGLAFTLNDGGTDFAAGDGFDIVVGAGTGKRRAIDFSSTVGADEAVGILIEAADATSADHAGVEIARDAEWSAADLTWPSGATTDQKNAAIAQLATRGIIVR